VKVSGEDLEHEASPLPLMIRASRYDMRLGGSQTASTSPHVNGFSGALYAVCCPCTALALYA
jgi:hypothetical protein